MGDAAPTGPGPLRVLRILFRVVLALGLVVLLVLIGIKQAPKVIAAMAATTPSSTTTALAIGGPTVAGSTAPPSDSLTPAPTIAVPKDTVPAGTGGGSGGSGGGTATTTAAATPRPVITQLSADGNADCPTQPSGAPDASAVPAPDVTIHWRSTGGVGDAYFGIGTSDAQAAPYSTVHQSDSITLTFPCTTRQQLYTVTVLGEDGTKVSRSITVLNTGTVG